MTKDKERLGQQINEKARVVRFCKSAIYHADLGRRGIGFGPAELTMRIKTQILGIAFLNIMLQFGCLPGNDVRPASVSREEREIPTISVQDGDHGANSEIDLLNRSRILDVELTDYGLLILTGFNGDASFSIFQQDGESWNKIGLERLGLTPSREQGTVQFYCIDFVDGQTGWASDTEMGIWRTSDGAKTWSRIGNVPDNSPAAGCRSLHFSSPRTGWITSFSGLYRTVDGGESWTRVKGIAADAGKIVFLDRLTGWIVAVDEDNNSTLYNTSDGGISWMSNNIKGIAIDEISPQTPTHGLIGARRRIFITSDAAKRLEGVAGMPEKFSGESIYCLDKMSCFVAGYEHQSEMASNPRDGAAVLFKTTDGAKTWSRLEIKTDEPFFSQVKFFGVEVGIVAGRNALFKTTDGGRSWSKILTIQK